ncbi:MAG: GtrA family protein [Jatrophihabitantaceae bacterium]
MTATPTRVSLPERARAYLRGSWRVLLKEVSAFGAVGVIAFTIDVGLFAWLSDHGAIKAKIMSATASTTFAYFGNRYLSFSHRARTSVRRETTFFFGINAITLVFSAGCIALFVYPLHFGHKSATVFAVNVVSIGLGTLFRFWSYKRFVFLHPDKVHAHNVDLDEELAE